MGAAAAVALVLAACGGSGKPEYCSAVDNLKASIKALPSTNTVQNGVSSLKTAVNKVATDAEKVVSTAKSDFPQETSALSSSVNALTSTVKQAASAPTAALLLQLPAQITAVANSVDSLGHAVSSKCG
jgi:phage-related minor tail protein